MDFKEWLTTFFTEKDLINKYLNIEHCGQTHIIDIPFMIEFLSTLPEEQQMIIKHNFCMIDFQDGEVMHFMDYLARGYLDVTFPTYI